MQCGRPVHLPPEWSVGKVSWAHREANRLLTCRRVSMLIMGHPQFGTQDDDGIGDGIPPISEWQIETIAIYEDIPELSSVEYEVKNVYARLNSVSRRTQQLPTAQLHDLTCFVVHRLLLPTSDTEEHQSSPITGCLRYAIILYMFIIHGPTYYSHEAIFNTITTKFTQHLQQLESTPRVYDLLDVWFLATGMVAAAGTPHYRWFMEQARAVATSLQLSNWDDVFLRIKSVLWLGTRRDEDTFRHHWEIALNAASHAHQTAICASSRNSVDQGLGFAAPA